MLEELIRYCTKNDSVARETIRNEESKNKIKQANNVARGIESNLSSITIRQLEDELEKEINLGDTSDLMHEDEVEMLNKRMQLLEHHQAINLARLEEHVELEQS